MKKITKTRKTARKAPRVYNFDCMSTAEVGRAMGKPAEAVEAWPHAGCPVGPDGMFCLPAVVEWHERTIVGMACQTLLVSLGLV